MNTSRCHREEGTKSAEGNGGILNYLLYGRDVAPSTLPDVVLLPSKTLRHAVDDGVIVMPDPPPTTTYPGRFVPGSRRTLHERRQANWYPLPCHQPAGCHRNDVFTQALPSTWNDLTRQTRYNWASIFPSRGARLLLGLYLSQRFTGG